MLEGRNIWVVLPVRGRVEMLLCRVKQLGLRFKKPGHLARSSEIRALFRACTRRLDCLRTGGPRCKLRDFSTSNGPRAKATAKPAMVSFAAVIWPHST